MKRVIPTTLSCVLLLLSPSPWQGWQGEGRGEGIGIHAIVLEQGAPLYDGPLAGAQKTGELAPWTWLELESRAVEDLQLDENYCTTRWSILTPEGRRWVDGAALAVREAGQRSQLEAVPWARDGSLVPDTSWFGFQRKQEWSENFGCDRLVEYGWLFTSGGGVMSSAQLTYTSGWGTSETLEQAAWIDLDGDGEAELISDWSTTITEAGNGGRLVRVLGSDLVSKLEVWVGDPRLMGLGQSEYGQLRLESARLIHEAITELPCPPDAPSAPTPNPSPEWGQTTCFSTERKTWQKLVASSVPFAATANGKQIVGWYHPEGGSASSAAQVQVQVLVWNGQAYEWLVEPTLSPAWLSGVFAGDAERARWVELH